VIWRKSTCGSTPQRLHFAHSIHRRPLIACLIVGDHSVVEVGQRAT
jgi:hypothetical protein